MQGRILDYSLTTSSGVITGLDGRRYAFAGVDWRGGMPPVRGILVDFEVEGDQARSVYRALGQAAVPGHGKDKLVAGLLAIFLGGLGMHKFYLGMTGPGLVYLLVNTLGLAVSWMLLFIPNFVLGVMALIEGVIYLSRSEEEFERLYVVEKKLWF